LPLSDRFINERLLEMFPLFDQAKPQFEKTFFSFFFLKIQKRDFLRFF